MNKKMLLIVLMANVLKGADAPGQAGVVINKLVDDQLSAITSSNEIMDSIQKTTQAKIYFNNLIEQKTATRETILARVYANIKLFEPTVAAAKTTLNQAKQRLLNNIKTYLEGDGKPQEVKPKAASAPVAVEK